LSQQHEVEVRSRFDGRWVSGFEVAGVAEEGYVLRRTSDGATLPSRFAAEEVRPNLNARRF